MKTNKSYTKRLKITKNGKILGRKVGQGHFNAKVTGTKRIAKRRMQSVAMTNKQKARFLPGK